MIKTKNKVRFRDTENLKTGNCTFKSVNEFKYLGVLFTENSEIKSKLKTRIAARSRCYHAFIRLLKSTTAIYCLRSQIKQ